MLNLYRLRCNERHKHFQRFFTVPKIFFEVLVAARMVNFCHITFINRELIEPNFLESSAGPEAFSTVAIRAGFLVVVVS